MKRVFVWTLTSFLCAMLPAAVAAEEIWVSHPFEGQITIHDRTGALLERIRDTASPASLALSPDGATVAVVDFAAGAVDIYDAATRTIVDRFDVVAPHANGEYLIYTPDGSHLWYFGASGIEIYSVPGFKLVRTVPIPLSFGFEQIVTDGRWMYTLAFDLPDVVLHRMSFDGAVNRIVPTGLGLAIPLPGLAYANGHLWLANPGARHLQQRAVPGGALVGKGRLHRADDFGHRVVANPSQTRLINISAFSSRKTVLDARNGRRVRGLGTRRCPTQNAAFLDDEWVAVTCFSRFFGLLNVETGAKKWIAVRGGDSWDVIVRH